MLKQSKAMESQIKNDILLRAITAYLRVIQARESVKYAPNLLLLKNKLN